MLPECVIVLVFVAALAQAAPAGQCASAESGTFLFDTVRPYRYYICQAGEPVVFNCPTGRVFDIKTHVCDMPPPQPNISIMTPHVEVPTTSQTQMSVSNVSPETKFVSWAKLLDPTGILTHLSEQQRLMLSNVDAWLKSMYTQLGQPYNYAYALALNPWLHTTGFWLNVGRRALEFWKNPLSNIWFPKLF